MEVTRMFEKNSLRTMLLGGIVVLLVLVLVKSSPDYVIAKGTGGVGDGGAGTRHVFALVGQEKRDRQPFYLIDTRQEVIMVYEYSVNGDGLGLVSVRNYKYDKLLDEYGKNKIGSSVKEIKKEIEKRGG